MSGKHIDKHAGSITVFLSLSFVLILALITTLLEAGAVAYAQSYAQLYLSMATESVIAEFNRPLFERYDLLAVDLGYGEGILQNGITGNLGNRLKYYLDANTKELYVKDYRIKEVTPLISDGEEEYFSQIAEYGLINLLPEAGKSILDRFTGIENAGKMTELTERRMELEDKFLEMDKDLIELMELIDGVRCRRRGFSVESVFVKKLDTGNGFPYQAGINNVKVYEALKPYYFRTSEGLLFQKSLTEEYFRLSELLKTAIGEEAESYREQMEKLGKYYRDNLENAAELVAEIKEKAELSLAKVQELRIKQEYLMPMVEDFERYTEDFKDSDFYQGIEETIGIMKNYVGRGSGSFPNLKIMERTLSTNIDCLTGVQQIVENCSIETGYEDIELLEGRLTEYSYEALIFDYSEITASGISGDILTSFFDKISEGFLNFLTDVSKLSDAVIDGGSLPSDWAKLNSAGEAENTEKSADLLDIGTDNSGYEEIENLLTDIGADVKNRLFNAMYVINHFSSFAENRDEEKVLQYETEYIIAGHNTDKQNLAAVAARIMMLRLVFSGAYVFTDMNVMKQAEAVAAAVIGWTCMSFLVSLVKYLIAFIWAMEQAFVETAAIMSGNRVPLFTEKQYFCIALQELITFSPTMVKSKAAIYKNNNRGPEYKEYLCIFLLAGNQIKEADRSLNLIQQNIRLEYNTGMLLSNCITSLTAEAEFEMKTNFNSIFDRIGNVSIASVDTVSFGR